MILSLLRIKHARNHFHQDVLQCITLGMVVENQARIEVVRVVVKQPHHMGRESLEKVAAARRGNIIWKEAEAGEIQENSSWGKRATQGAVGWDFYSCENKTIIPLGRAAVNTGIQVQRVPEGSFLKLETKSGLAANQGIVTLAGIIDWDYAGSV